MAGNWMDDRDREIREQGWQARDYRRDGPAAPREGRSWQGEQRPDRYAARRSGPDRDPVFGEQERGVGYTDVAGPAGGYQGRAHGGPAPYFGSQDYTRGDRFEGDDSRERIYREEFGYGPGARDGAYSPARAAYRKSGFGDPGFDDYGHDNHGRPLSAGTGGYDYGRGEGERPSARAERFEDAGRKSGEFLHRAGQKVASWFAAGDTYDRGHRGRGPKAYKRSDERISEDAHERLTEDPWLDASDISLAVSGGEVTLSGTVEDRDAKHHAERIVEHLSGVTHVQNNLRIAGSGYGETPVPTDDAVANGTGGAGGGQSMAGRKS